MLDTWCRWYLNYEEVDRTMVSITVSNGGDFPILIIAAKKSQKQKRQRTRIKYEKFSRVIL